MTWMTPEEIKQTIDDFLALIETGSGSVEENEKELKLLLDKLALAQHFAECSCDERESSTSPGRSYEELRKMVSTRFPSFGFYNIAEHVAEKVGESGTMVGDAIDDVADIARDLSDVKWRWENNGPDDGLWEFRFSFEIHWSQHLRELQLYLVHHSHQGDKFLDKFLE